MKNGVYLVAFKDRNVNNDFLKATVKQSNKYPDYVWVDWENNKGNLIKINKLFFKSV